MTTLDAPKGSRVTIQIVKVEAKPMLRDHSRSTITYTLHDEDGWQHLWHSSHRDVSIPEGDGPLFITATAQRRWGYLEEKGYYLERGRFSRGEGEAAPVEIVRHRW